MPSPAGSAQDSPWVSFGFICLKVLHAQAYRCVSVSVRVYECMYVNCVHVAIPRGQDTGPLVYVCVYMYTVSMPGIPRSQRT